MFNVITYVLITQKLSTEIKIIMEDGRIYHSFDMTKNNKKLGSKYGNMQAKLHHLYSCFFIIFTYLNPILNIYVNMFEIVEHKMQLLVLIICI